MKRKLKIAYLIVGRSFPGLSKQIEYENLIFSDLKEINFNLFAFLVGEKSHKKILDLPRPFKSLIGQKLFAWIWLLKFSRKFDYVIIRHIVFDPFVLFFGWFVRNRIIIHHAKEFFEIKYYKSGWRGKIAAYIELFTGYLSTRTSAGILGVTNEICEFQKEFKHLPENFPVCFYPNAIAPELVKVIDDNRKTNEINIGFMAGNFKVWHGLDLILKAISKYKESNSKKIFKLHLIGKISKEYFKKIEEINSKSKNKIIMNYGVLDMENYQKILSFCDVGLGSLAMHRAKVREGSTLKVREMLGMGLPVYSAHIDTAIPQDFPFYFNGPISVEKILEYAEYVSSFSRDEIRNRSLKYIDKKIYVKKLSKFLINLSNN